MKNLKAFGEVNEKMDRHDLIPFEFFIDFKTMKPADFKSQHGEDEMYSEMLNKVKALWADCNLEQGMYPNSLEANPTLQMKPKYPYLYFFYKNIGEPTIHIISTKNRNSLISVDHPESM